MPTSTEQDCDKLIAALYGPSAIVRLGQKGKRTRNTDGVPDRLYWCRELVLFECKSANDYLSPAQVTFLCNAIARGSIAGCGNRDDLCTLLNAVNFRTAGLAQVEKYRTRQKALRGA